MLPALELRMSASIPAPAALDLDEARLVRDTLGGTAEAFDQIVRVHHRRVFNFVFQMTRQRQDAEDLTQQTFVKAYTRLASFDLGLPLINWLLGIARNNALNHFRAAKNWEEMPEDTESHEPSPALAAENRDDTSQLWACARAELSRREFEVLWLRFAEDLSLKETAEIVGLTQTHVKVLVFRARRTLLKRRLSP
jgi:RNA polymerase sigma-70 factor (ECF subfamily)